MNFNPITQYFVLLHLLLKSFGSEDNKKYHTDNSLEYFSEMITSCFFPSFIWKPDRLRDRVAGSQFSDVSSCQMF